MASVPTPGPGSIVIVNNMREARQNGMSRNMATASTYYWFYQKSEMADHGIIKNSIRILLLSVISTSVPQGLLQEFLQRSCLWAQVGLSIAQVP